MEYGNELLSVPPPIGISVPIAPASGLGSALYPAKTGISTRNVSTSDYQVFPNAPPLSPDNSDYGNADPIHMVPPPSTNLPPSKDHDDDNPNGGQYDDLAARFSQFKR
jgi:hypothetical protein